MAKIFNEQRRLGVVIVPDGTTLYNNQPVIGIRDASAALFVDNQRTLGVDVQASAGVYNGQPILGAVWIVDGRTMYNGKRVIPATTAGFTAGQVATLARLKAAAAAALISNPVINADMASPPTASFASSHDASLTVRANPQANPELFRVSIGNKYIRTTTNAVYVGTQNISPGTAGNLSAITSLTPAIVPGDSEICYQVDFIFTGQILELDMKTGANSPYRLIVDGQFAVRDGYSSLSQFAKFDFGSSATRKITVEVNAGLAFQGVSVSAGGSITPNMDTVVKGAVTGDSITESIVSGETVFYPYDGIYSNFGKRVGINSIRNTAIGGTGYWNTASAGRNNILGQLPYWINADTYDHIMFAGGYNDAGQASDATVVALALQAWQLARASQPNAFIMVMGVWPEATGPGASRISLENALAAQFAAWGDKFSCFIPVATDQGGAWTTGTGYVGHENGTGNSDIYVSSDGTHPSRPGRLYLGGRCETAYRAIIAAM